MHSSDNAEPRLYGVLSHAIDTVWKEIKPLLIKTLEYADGKYNLDDIYQFIKSQDMQLWVVYDNKGLLSFCITQIIIYPRKKVLSMPFVGGVDMLRWLHLTDIIKDYALENGCDFAEGYARDGWIKVLKPFGFKKTYTIIKADL
jgi:hypothetical protein